MDGWSRAVFVVYMSYVVVLCLSGRALRSFISLCKLMVLPQRKISFQHASLFAVFPYTKKAMKYLYTILSHALQPACCCSVPLGQVITRRDKMTNIQYIESAL